MLAHPETVSSVRTSRLPENGLKLVLRCHHIFNAAKAGGIFEVVLAEGEETRGGENCLGDVDVEA